VGVSLRSFISYRDDRANVYPRTAAAVTAGVMGGADIVRVHDVAEMRKVVSMAEAIWRVPVSAEKLE